MPAAPLNYVVTRSSIDCISDENMSTALKTALCLFSLNTVWSAAIFFPISKIFKINLFAQSQKVQPVAAVAASPESPQNLPGPSK